MSESTCATPKMHLHYCSFCGKDQTKVNVLLVDKYASICDDCVRISQEAIEDHLKQRRHEKKESK